MGIPLLLIGIAVVLFLAKSKIPNSDLERLANVTSIVIFLFGVLSLFLSLPSMKEIGLLEKPAPPTAGQNDINSSVTTYTIPLTYTVNCELKEFVAYFETGETLSIDYEFPTGFFSAPAASHVGFVMNGPDFGDGFKVDEILSYSTTHKISKSGEYRVGFVWHGRYDVEVTVTLPKKNWQIVVTDCSKD